MTQNHTDHHKVLLRTAGLKVTAQRMTVLALLDRESRPLSVPQMRALLASPIDEVTLYRMMRDFEAKNIVRPVDLRTVGTHYELAAHAHHHHIVCTQCGRIEDVPSCDLDGFIAKAVKRATHFTHADDHTFELFGICNTCKKNS